LQKKKHQKSEKQKGTFHAGVTRHERKYGLQTMKPHHNLAFAKRAMAHEGELLGMLGKHTAVTHSLEARNDTISAIIDEVHHAFSASATIVVPELMNQAEQRAIKKREQTMSISDSRFCFFFLGMTDGKKKQTNKQTK
jgi:hypothetical protein